jgi:sulfatase modifying factor 1
MKRACISIVLCLGLVSVADAGGTGTILFEHFWTNGLSTLDGLLMYAQPYYPNWPNSIEWRTSFEGPINWRDSYGTRVRGYLIPPQDGNYTFWIASDDQSELLLSKDPYLNNCVTIASVPGWVPSRDFDNVGGGTGGPQQKSSPIPLKAGLPYYFTAYQIEGSGYDHLAVAWQGPGIPNREIIQGQYVMPPTGGLKGEYFGNMTLEGSPTFTRIDPEINFGWWGGGEVFPFVSDRCSVRWTGQVEAPLTESYTFYVSTDDGARLWLDGKPIIDAWVDQGNVEHASAAIRLTAGGHDIRLEWYENAGNASCKLLWSSPSTPKQIIPSGQLIAYSYGGGVGTADCPSADLTGNCIVDLEDFAVMALQWLTGKGPALAADMVAIPGGAFLMGDSVGDGEAIERPVHTVTLDSFAMGKYEITNGQYRDFLNSALAQGLITVTSGMVCKSGTSYPSYCFTSTSSPYSQITFSNNTFGVRWKLRTDMSNDPMVGVNWYGAVAYCNWRSQREGKQPCYDLSTWTCDFTKNGYRLPTEAEWEYAARGGLSGKRFPWGDTITHSQANYYSRADSYDTSPTRGFHPTWSDVGEPYTSQVGSFPANAYGLYDMAGNVFEWCNDWYSGTYYSSSPTNNPTGPTTGSIRVLRGGCWTYDSCLCRVSHRDGIHPYTRRNDYLGFRVVLDLN